MLTYNFLSESLYVNVNGLFGLEKLKFIYRILMANRLRIIILLYFQQFPGQQFLYGD